MSNSPNRKLQALSIAACFTLGAFSLAQAAPFPQPNASGTPTPPAASATSFVTVLSLTDGEPHTGGAGTSKIVITAIDITNSSSTAVRVLFTNSPNSNSTCTTVAATPGPLQMHFYVQPQSTLALSYPAGFVVRGSKHNCFTGDIGSAASGAVEMMVVGYTQ